MALVGGGGAGNVAGSNPSGTGSSITYVGDYAYAHSGVVSVTDASTALVDFTTGNEIIDSIVQFYYGELSGDNMRYSVKMNGETIISYEVSEAASAAQYPDPQIYLIIPPYTHVQLLAENESSSSGRAQLATLRGVVTYA